MILVLCSLLAAMSSADAVAVLLNSRGAVGEKTFVEARAIVEREAKDGKPLQQFVVGLTAKDKARAKVYLDVSRDKIKAMAEKTNNALAWYLLSVETNNFRYLVKAAEGGNVQALNALGTMITQDVMTRPNVSSNEVEQTLQRSYDCFRQAAVKRDPNGFVNLGTCYLRGFGCKQDMALAFLCFKSAADAGHPEAMDNVSACYQFGHGVKKNDELSLIWRMRGRAARGDAAAAKWLEERK